MSVPTLLILLALLIGPCALVCLFVLALAARREMPSVQTHNQNDK